MKNKHNKTLAKLVSGVAIAMPLLSVGLGMMVFGSGGVVEASSIGRTTSLLRGGVVEEVSLLRGGATEEVPLSRRETLSRLHDEKPGIEMTRLRSRKPRVSSFDHIRHVERFAELRNPDPSSLFRQSLDTVLRPLRIPTENFPLERYGIRSEYDLFNTPVESVRYHLREGEEPTIIIRRDFGPDVIVHKATHSYIDREFDGRTTEQVLTEHPEFEKFDRLGQYLETQRRTLPLYARYDRGNVPLVVNGERRFGYTVRMFHEYIDPSDAMRQYPTYPITYLRGKYPVHFDYVDLRKRYYESGLDIFSEETDFQIQSIAYALGIDAL